MADKIRVGIVGATTRKVGSGWGANAHIPALNALEDYELVAVCTEHEDSAKESAQEFGAELYFTDAAEMISQAEIDLVSVVVKVPRHEEVVVPAIESGKAVFCEWPLAANLAQAESLAALAADRAAFTAVGLQARSDPAIVNAANLLAGGEIGDVLAVNLRTIAPGDVERPPFRLWQGERKLGANPLSIAGGHAFDVIAFLLGDFVEISGRAATRIDHWIDSESGEQKPVDAPDVIGLIGRLSSGVEVAAQIASVPAGVPGYELQIYGSKGTLVLAGGFISGGPNKVALGVGRGAPEPVETPGELTAAIDAVPAGPGRNVAAAYVRIAAALRGGTPYDPSFADAVELHRLIDAIERGGFPAAVA